MFGIKFAKKPIMFQCAFTVPVKYWFPRFTFNKDQKRKRNQPVVTSIEFGPCRISVVWGRM